MTSRTKRGEQACSLIRGTFLSSRDTPVTQTRHKNPLEKDKNKKVRWRQSLPFCFRGK